MHCPLWFQKLLCARDAAARVARENLATAGSRADRAKTIGLNRPPSPWEKHRGDSLGAKARDRSYDCGSRISECGLTIAPMRLGRAFKSAIRIPQSTIAMPHGLHKIRR